MINKKKLMCVYIFYCILLSWVILFRLNIAEFCGKYNGICYIPFEDKYNYTSSLAKFICEIGNVISFIPAGIYLSLFFKENQIINRVLKSICFIIILSLFFEVVQYILVIGFSSTTDLIHNTIGGLIGIVIYEVFRRYVSNEKINLINKVTLYFIIPLSVFAVISTLININLYV